MGYTCLGCGRWVDDFQPHVCSGQYHFPNVNFDWTWPNYWSNTPQFICPNCKGAFTYWEDNKCPFCGMEKGKYPKKD